MWIVDYDAKFFWILADKTYLVGRTISQSSEKVDIPIQYDSSVSRKHASFQVRYDLEAGSQFIIYDHNSRFGTTLNGEKVHGNNPRILNEGSSRVHSLRCGRNNTRLRIWWKPLVVTILKDQLESKDKWTKYLDRSRLLGFRLTSHLVSNTDALLKIGKVSSSIYYAMANQIPIVDESYFSALEDCASSASTHGTSSSSLLPEFENHYPNAIYKPTPARRHCLKNREVGVLDSAYGQLMKPILEAAGGTFVESNIPLYLVTTADVPKLPIDAAYILSSTLFTIITESRSLRSDEIKRKTETSISDTKPVGPKKRSPTGKKLLDMLTSSGDVKNLNLNSANAAFSSVTKVAGTTYASANTILTVRGAISRENEFTVNNEEADLESSDPELSKADPVNTSHTIFSKKRNAPPKRHALPSKKLKLKDESVSENISSEVCQSDTTSSQIDFTRLGELTIVESDFSVERPKKKTPTTLNTGQTNFKAFKRKSNISKTKSAIEFDTQLPNAISDSISVPLSDLPRNTGSDGLAMDNGSKSTFVIQSASTNNFTKDNRSPRHSSEDVLFISDTVSEVEPSISGNDILSSAIRTQNLGNNEFGFSF